MLALVAIPGTAVAADKVVSKGPSPRATAQGPANFDVRSRAPAKKPGSRTARAQRRLRRSLGRGAILRLDRATGTPDIVGRTDGFLTPRRGGGPARIALDFLRSNAAAYGLDRDDLSALRLKRRATTRRGLTRIEWEQVHEGVPAFDNIVRANVSRGRLVNITGAPKPDLSVRSTKPRLDAPDAVEGALRSVGRRTQVRVLRKARDGTVLLSGGNRAKLVLFVGPGGTRLAWSTVARRDRQAVYRAVVDASSGEVLKRANLVQNAAVHAFDYTPIHPPGNAVTARDAPTTGEDPWLTGGLDRLRGDNTLTYSDEEDDTYIASCPIFGPCTKPGPTAAQEIPPSSGSGSAADATWNYPQVTGTPPGSNCPSTGCTWDGAAPLAAPFAPGDNWQKNREQAGTQLFYFVNKFHDHLQNDPNIDFSDAWGNFEQDATVAGAVDGDPVHAQVDDGAAKGPNNDFPDASHLNNASMLTLEEIPGDPLNSPEMSMYLFGELTSDVNASHPYDVNGSDDAAIVYHEYTHGLSHRLVDPNGVNALETAQGGAMGEGWSDWYAIDYLNQNGFEPDASGSVDVFYGEYENVPFGFQGLDCTVGNTADCAAPPGGAGAGGFTYGDFGKIDKVPEVHADGEIWAQTLWDLRRALIGAHGSSAGIARARALVTDGMRLSPASSTRPDFLDMRNAILQAATMNGFADCSLIWTVFAARGMGVGAASTDGNDITPTQSFTPGTSCAADGGGTGGGGTGGGTTTPVPTSPPPAPPVFDPSISIPARADLSSVPRSIRVDRRGRFRLRFRGAAGHEGTATIRTVSRVRTSTTRRRLRVARRSFTVSSTGRVSMRLRLSRRNLRILKLNRRYRVRLTVELRNAFGQSTATKRFILRAPRT